MLYVVLSCVALSSLSASACEVEGDNGTDNECDGPANTIFFLPQRAEAGSRGSGSGSDEGQAVVNNADRCARRMRKNLRRQSPNAGVTEKRSTARSGRVVLDSSTHGRTPRASSLSFQRARRCHISLLTAARSREQRNCSFLFQWGAALRPKPKWKSIGQSRILSLRSDFAPRITKAA